MVLHFECGLRALETGEMVWMDQEGGEVVLFLGFTEGRFGGRALMWSGSLLGGMGLKGLDG